jgi:peptidoglycan biosynthesis protein MviN/MurJ (putative lipid II flippase)
MATLITLLVYLIIIALIWWAITYALANLPLPGPVKQFGTVIATLVIVIVVVYFLLSLAGGGMPDLSLHR